MSVRLTPSSQDWDSAKKQSAKASDLTSIVFDIEKKRVEVKRGQIQKIAMGLSEIAYSIGQTNDQQKMADLLGEDIWEALKKVKKRQEDKRKKKRNS